MRGGVTLHPKYGLNPSLEKCFWCQEDTGSILLPGIKQLRPGYRQDGESPKYVCLSYEPCDSCKVNHAKGFWLICVTTKSKKTVEIAPGVWPTGDWCVMKEEAAARIFDEDTFRSLMHHGKAFLDEEVWKTLQLDQFEDGENPRRKDEQFEPQIV